MTSQVSYLILGAFLGYGGHFIQNILEATRQKNNSIRQEKIRIYSQVVSELGSLFLDKDSYKNELLSNDHLFKFSLNLGKILAPARLIASDNLEEKIRDLYDKEIDWHKSLFNSTSSEEEEEKLAAIATQARLEVEKEMRNELK